MAKDDQIDLKDIALLVPLTATALAFVPIGGFQYFSITEHITAAAPAIPVALAFSLLIPFFVANRHFGSHLRTRYSLRSRLITAFTALIGCALLASALRIWWPHERQYNISFLIFLAILAFSVIDSLFLSIAFRTRASLYAFGILLYTMVFAAEGSLHSIRGADAGKNLTKVSTKEGLLEGRVFMVGQQGLLIYVPASKQLRFERADAIKAVEWSGPSSSFRMNLR